ncbi:MAG TPA: ABC transporter permease, partial [Actinomycetota bacterium]|nr:ABC transporter permease [Actinomycetota bacterium]
MPDDEPTRGPDTLVEDEDEEARLEDAMLRGSSGGLQVEAATATAAAAEGGVSDYQASLWGDAWRQLRRNPLFLIAATLLLLFTVVAIAPGLFTSQDPRDCFLSNTVGRPQRGHWFGFDIQGCDYYTRVLYGTRVSLIIGLLVVGVDVVIAIALGSIAGFFGKFWDGLIGRMADIWFALPTTLAGIVFLNMMGQRGLLQVAFVLIFLGWPTLMRLMRSSVLAGREADYVLAARALGASNWRILRAHILPNGIAPVIVYGTISVGIIISAEAALSFLGVGLQLPAISWGLMISAAQNRILQSPHLLLFPALFLSLLVLCFIIIG